MEFVGEDGPRQMGIPAQSSVADAFSSRDWQRLSRYRNVNISILRNTIQSLPLPNASRGSDIFLWDYLKKKKKFCGVPETLQISLSQLRQPRII